MRSSWAQPSLSRDFALLSAAVLFVLALISGWVTYKTYKRHHDNVTLEMGKEASRIERILAIEMGEANYMLASLGRQIIIDPNRSYTKLAQSLKSFDSKNHIYSILSWVSPEKKLVVSSNRGVLEEPVDISDRDFIQQSVSDSWKMHIGRPIEGRVSHRWVVPASMGVTDYTGKFIGIISVSMDIDVLTRQISDLINRDGISFAIINKDLVPLSEVSDRKNFIVNNFPTDTLKKIDFEKNPSGLLDTGNMIWGTGIYTYYRAAENSPYVILMGYDANYSDEIVRTVLWSRLLQIFMIAVFFVLFLWIVRVRVINPVLDMTDLIASIIRGERKPSISKKSSVEMAGLSRQVEQVSKYIDETVRVENELRNKMFLLKKAKESAEFSVRSKSEFLAYIAQEIRMPLNNIIGFAQVLKDQLSGSMENRKYKQYANDIYVIANQIIDKIQSILLYSKAENGYIDLQEKSLEVSAVISAALRQLSDKLQVNKTSVKVDLQDPLPHLLADEFRLQQIIINLLLIILDDIKEDSVIKLEVKTVSEYRDKQFLALIIKNMEAEDLSNGELLAIAQKQFAAESVSVPTSGSDIEESSLVDLRTELAKLLMSLHGGALYIKDNGGLSEEHCHVVFFPFFRLNFED